MQIKPHNNPVDKPGPSNLAGTEWPIYNPQQIEPKWQRKWEENGLYRSPELGGKPKFYCLDFSPYPSGDGLHVGHCRNYVPDEGYGRCRISIF